MEKIDERNYFFHGGGCTVYINDTLVFLKQNVEIARILYNDIAYPASAVKIMNGEIIRPHMVELWKQ